MQAKHHWFPPIKGGNVPSPQDIMKLLSSDTMGERMVSNAEKVLVPVRWLYLGLGLAFVGLGSIGFFLPVMPSTIFFILALWAFKRSSPRLEQRLLNHRVLGPTLRDWDENRTIKLRTKQVAITMIWVCLLLSSMFVKKPFVWVILGVVGISLTWYLATRKTSAASVMS